MKLTPRLEKISELVSNNKYIADIGTDHGYIPTYLLLNKKIDKAILADINKGPLENARKEIEKYGLESKVSLRLGSGLNILEKNEVDEVIIAGMGGILISEILEENMDISKSLDKLILQPMQASDELRKYLNKSKFEVLEEHLVKEEHRIYEIIVCRYNDRVDVSELNEIEYTVSKPLIESNSDLLHEFIEKKIYECDSILNKISDFSGEEIEDRKKYISNRKKELEIIINGLRR